MPQYRNNLSDNIIGFSTERLIRMLRECEWGNISLGVVIVDDNRSYEFTKTVIGNHIYGNPNWDYCETTVAETYDRYIRYRNDIHSGEVFVCSSLYWRNNDSLRERANIALYDGGDPTMSYIAQGWDSRYEPYLRRCTTTLSVDESLYSDYTYANISYTPYLTGSWVNINSTGDDYTATNRTWYDLGYANISTNPIRLDSINPRDVNELYEKLFGKRCEKEEDLQESPELDKYLEEFLVIKP